ncbi:uncharacterized protein LOC127748905 [Frankliniella occidentalis]|uniref:Uncharacterized protein LOC127748905 n=1 Tax=Frankliniella occidentalis TaxID=133901 RepID=A0A9C6TPV7_FRAOC|nr:uncharacterized protein LOC127748905 [Frankliniella occidentalis]
MRQTRFWAILHKIRSLVQTMESYPGDKGWEDHTRREIRRFFAGIIVMAVFISGSVWLSLILTGTSILPLWPFVPYAGPFGVYLAWLFYDVVSVLIILGAISFVVTALVCVTCTAAGLHYALAQRIATNETPEVVKDVVLMHQQLRDVARDLITLFDGNLAHIMASSFCNSLFATIQVLANDVTSSTFALLLPVVVIFLQLSHYSQELFDSSLKLQRAAFHAATGGTVAFLEARALNLVILVAGTPPTLHCKGLGQLSLADAGKAFRQFYSTVSVLGPKY